MENDAAKVVKGHEQLSYEDRLTYLAEPNGSSDPTECFDWISA